MSGQEEFVKKVEAILNLRVGAIIGGSIMKSNLSKMNKAAASLTKEDCKLFVENIIKSVSLFGSKDELKLVRSDLEDLLKNVE